MHSNILKKLSESEKELAYLTLSLFVYEAFLKNGIYETHRNGGYQPIEIELKGTEKIKLDLQTVNDNEASTVSHVLRLVLSFCLDVFPEIELVSGSKIHLENNKRPLKSNESVALFSGGVDSFAGLSVLNEMFSIKGGIFVSHGSPALKHLLSKRLMPLFVNKDIELVEVDTSKGRSGGVQQLRGLLYMIMGALYGRTRNSNRLVVSEIGPTMFQTPYDILDEVTLTTHPFVIWAVKALYKSFFNDNLTIHLPFKDMTKADALSLIDKNNGYSVEIKKTNSCRNTSFANAQRSHCGKCLGCIVRRISMILAGFESPEEDYYAWDVLVMNINEAVIGRAPNAHIHFNNMSNILMLVESARKILLDEWNDMSFLKVKDFGMKELFRIFALDVFTTLYLLYDKSNIGRNEFLKQFYVQCKKEGIINENIANKRLLELSGKASFSKINKG